LLLRLGEKNVFTIAAGLVPMREGRLATIDVTTNHLAELCTDVEGRLRQIIEEQIEEYWKKTTQTSSERTVRELEIEQAEHKRFGNERGSEHSFVGRETELTKILEYLRNNSLWPLVIHGVAGCGKTALLARAAEEIQKEKVNGHNTEVIARFVGITPRSSDIRSLLSSLCQELRLAHPRKSELPADAKALGEELHEHFRSATPEQPLILFVDALDQLSDADAGRLLHWIPSGQFPPHVKFVVSCLSDRASGDPASQPFVQLKLRGLPAENFIRLDVLSEYEAKRLLFDRWLKQAGRSVGPDQRESIEKRLVSPACRQPIYLKLLFEEARLWRSYDLAPDLGEDACALVSQLFERLSRPANHGQLLGRVMSYLAASRNGLAENEILELLFVDTSYRAALNQAREQTDHELPNNATRIPIAIWSRLRFDLAPYLTERAAIGANVLMFYHSQLQSGAASTYLATEEQRQDAHSRLASYFSDLADPTKDGRWLGRSPRAYAELSHHQLAAGQQDQLREELMGYRYMQAKLNATDSTELLTDFRALGGDRDCTLVQQALALGVAILARDKQQLAAQMVGHLWGARGTRSIDGFLAVLLGCLPRPHLLPQMSVFEASAGGSRLANFEGHRSELLGALQLSDNSLLTWSIDQTLRRWDLDGREVAVFVGHESPVNGALELSDGTILSWSDPIYEHGRTLGKPPGNTLRRWDTDGQQIAVFEGHSAGATGALQLSDGNVLSWSGGRHRTDHGISLGRIRTSVEWLRGTPEHYSRGGALRRHGTHLVEQRNGRE
jgi:AAA ATPase domain